MPDVSTVPTFRSWTKDGHDFRALNPVHLAVGEYYMLQGLSLKDRVDRIDALVAEIRRGERRPLPGMLDRILEIDREQQASGCPDDHLVDLVTLLRTAGARALRPLGD
jgi:hypothetical protein